MKNGRPLFSGPWSWASHLCLSFFIASRSIDEEAISIDGVASFRKKFRTCSLACSSVSASPASAMPVPEPRPYGLSGSKRLIQSTSSSSIFGR